MAEATYGTDGKVSMNLAEFILGKAYIDPRTFSSDVWVQVIESMLKKLDVGRGVPGLRSLREMLEKEHEYSLGLFSFDSKQIRLFEGDDTKDIVKPGHKFLLLHRSNAWFPKTWEEVTRGGTVTPRRQKGEYLLLSETNDLFVLNTKWVPVLNPNREASREWRQRHFSYEPGYLLLKRAELHKYVRRYEDSMRGRGHIGDIAHRIAARQSKITAAFSSRAKAAADKAAYFDELVLRFTTVNRFD